MSPTNKKPAPAKELLEELNADGQSTLAIAKRFQVTPKTVSKWYQDYGIQRHNAKELLRLYLGASEPKLRQLTSEGLSIAQIAEHFGVSYNTASGWLRGLSLSTAKTVATRQRLAGITRESLEQYIKQGISREELSRLLRLDVRVLSRLYHKHGLKPYRSPRSYKRTKRPITRELLESFNEGGLTVQEIAVELGLQSTNTVRSWYKRLQLQRPSMLELNAVKRGLTLEQIQTILSSTDAPELLMQSLKLSSSTMLHRWTKKIPQIKKETQKCTSQTT